MLPASPVCHRAWALLLGAAILSTTFGPPAAAQTAELPAPAAEPTEPAPAAESPAPQSAAGPVVRSARRVPLGDEVNDKRALGEGKTPDAAHPLTPVLRYATAGLAQIDADIRDYTCLLVKRERIGGRLLGHEYIEAKVRHERREGDRIVTPFSVYLKWLGPAKVKGREVLYVTGRNDGQMIARNGGQRFAFITVELDPAGDAALSSSRYPITDFGFKTLVRRLLESGEQDRRNGQCEVKQFAGAKVAGRLCRAFHIVHPERNPGAIYHAARIYIDEQLDVPVHYELYDWPAKEEAKPELLEQYTFTRIELNVGLTDDDFRRDNPAYGFR